MTVSRHDDGSLSKPLQLSEELSDETIRQRRLDVQRRDHKFHRFVEDNLILKSGLIDKKKGLFARRRMFLLTEGPRLFYVDPINLELRGEIPFSADLKTEAKNFRTFFVHTVSTYVGCTGFA